jgi:CRISPR-associated protein Cst2
MAFVTGLMLIDAPASALNNLGTVPGLFETTVGVKVIRTREGTYPYVSAQAFRYWLRTTLENAGLGWQAAPIYREEKVAYTDANPIKWWDDDLFGYMRAPGTGAAAKARQEDPEYQKLTPLEVKDGKEQAVTRVSPFRVSTLVSIAPVVSIVEDWESLSRHEGDPVPYSNQFYRATLKGLFSLDLHASGTFSYRNKTGFRNLDSVRIEEAKKAGLEELKGDKAYRLPLAERVKRVAALFEGLAQLEGGAKQTLHYTDVAPVFTILAVTKGGNHIFGHVVGANSKGLPEIKIEALKEALTVFKDDILSDVYVGWVKGYLDDERARFEAALADEEKLAAFANLIKISHPREAFKAMAAELRKAENASWLD